jgi:phosphoglycerate dehydrogenase-like enzyme
MFDRLLFGRDNPLPFADRVRVHIKNNHAGPHTFPSTPEGEAVFTITPERFEAVAAKYPDVAKRLEPFFDWDEDHFAESMGGANAFVGWNLPTANLAKLAPHLRLIHCTGAGVEHLSPMDWLPRGAVLVNSKGVHADKCGEFGLMSILMLHNRIPQIITNQRSAHWESLYATPIAGRVLLIIGVGNIGQAVAKQAKRVGLTVLGVSRHGCPAANIDEAASVDRLDDFLTRADFVFVATPLTRETRSLLDKRRLRLMKNGSGLINVGRSAVVDYDCLVELLESGHLSGAVLDVFSPEPLSKNSQLWQTKNLIITPHVSGDDAETYVELTLDLFFQNMRRLFAGEPLRNVVRTDLGY